jgi:tetratricopeptide (TPR) repeat protein
MKLLLKLTIVFILLFTANVFAEKNNKANEKQLDVSLQIDALTENDVMLPKHMIEKLDLLISLSKKNDWLENLLKANTLKAELLVFLEQLPQAKEILNTYHAIAKANHFNKLDIRLQLVALSLSNSEGYTLDVEKQISSLETSVANWPDKREAGSIYNVIGHSLYVHGKFERSLANLQKAYKIFASLNDSTNLGDTLNSIANLYRELGDLNKAINYLQKAVVIKRELNDSLSVSIILYNLGDAYSKNDQYELALAALSESLQLSVSIDDKLGIAWAKQSLADLGLKQNKPQDALTLYLETATAFESTGDDRRLFHTYLGIIDCYLLLNKLPKA